MPESYNLEEALEEKETTRLSFIYSRGKPLTKEQISYAGRDAADLLVISTRQKEALLADDPQLLKVAQWEWDIIPPIGDAQLKGITVDVSAWKVLADEARKECSRLYDELQICFLPKEYVKAFGDSINNVDTRLIKTCDPDSPLDMLRVFEKFGYIRLGKIGLFQKKDGKEVPSTGDDVLMNYRRTLVKTLESKGIDPETIKRKKKPLDLLLEYREWSQRLKTFGDNWIAQYVSDVTGFVHARLNQYGADSGRMSCLDPNLQQIPSRGDQAEKYRHCFIARPGCVLVGSDWSQLELRILASASGDMIMIEVFNTGKDLHTMSAALFLAQDYDKILWRISKENTDVTDKAKATATRTLAKTVGFGVAYGMGPDQLSIRTAEADPEGIGKPAYCDLTWKDFQNGVVPCDDCARCALAKFRNTYPGAIKFLDEAKKSTRFNLRAYDLGGGRRLFTKPDPRKIAFQLVAERVLKDNPALKREKDKSILQAAVQEAMNKHKYFEPEELESKVADKERAEWASIEREGANHVIQGTNARMIKVALRKVWERIQPFNATILLVVHDEIVIECKEDDAPAVKKIVEEEMEKAAQLLLTNAVGKVATPAKAVALPYWSK